MRFPVRLGTHHILAQSHALSEHIIKTHMIMPKVVK